MLVVENGFIVDGARRIKIVNPKVTAFNGDVEEGNVLPIPEGSTLQTCSAVWVDGISFSKAEKAEKAKTDKETAKRNEVTARVTIFVDSAKELSKYSTEAQKALIEATMAMYKE